MNIPCILKAVSKRATGSLALQNINVYRMSHFHSSVCSILNKQIIGHEVGTRYTLSFLSYNFTSIMVDSMLRVVVSQKVALVKNSQ